MEANDLFCFASFQFRQKYENHFYKEVFQWNLSHGFIQLVENHIFPHLPNAELC